MLSVTMDNDVASIDIGKIYTTCSNPAIYVRCGCGNELIVNLFEWKINVIGMLQFRCVKCGNIINTPNSLWDKEQNGQ